MNKYIFRKSGGSKYKPSIPKAPHTKQIKQKILDKNTRPLYISRPHSSKPASKVARYATSLNTISQRPKYLYISKDS